jgi:hypothetical protein
MLFNSNFKKIAIIFAALFFKQSMSQIMPGPCTLTSCRTGECEQLLWGHICHCEEVINFCFINASEHFSIKSYFCFFNQKQIKGNRCDRPFIEVDNACASSPCWSGGTCVPIGHRDWKCLCPLGVLGKNCREIATSPCTDPNLCKNKGICRVTTNNGI